MNRPVHTLAAALGIVLFTGCTSWHRTASPAEGVAKAKSGEIRVYRADGSTIQLVNASIVGDSLVGTSPVTGARISMPTAAVVSTETKQVSAGRTAALGGGVLVGVIAVTAILTFVALIASLGG